MKQVQGVLVNSVVSGGPADHAGLKSGDVILDLNGTAVNDVNTLRKRVAAAGPGTDVALTILRNGGQQEVHVKLGEFMPHGGSAGGATGSSESSPGKLGISVQPLIPDLAAQLGLPRTASGLVVANVDPGGPAGTAGIQSGDVIQEVNHQPVRTAEDLLASLQKSGGRPALLLINRKGQTVFVPVRLR